MLSARLTVCAAAPPGVEIREPYSGEESSSTRTSRRLGHAAFSSSSSSSSQLAAARAAAEQEENARVYARLHTGMRELAHEMIPGLQDGGQGAGMPGPNDWNADSDEYADD